MKKIIEYISKYYLLIFTIIVFIILAVIHLSLRNYAFDDAYIHFRIASHLAKFGQPYYNLGEPVMASSSTGWTILLAMLVFISSKIGLNINVIIWASFINAITCAGGAYIYTRLFDRLVNKPQSWVIRIIFALTYLGLLLPSSIGLMETPTVMTLTGLALLLLLKNNKWCLVIFGMLPFLRPEFVVVSGLAFIYIRITRRFSFKEHIFYYVLGVVPFILFDLFFFKTLIPNTIKAKSIVYAMTYIETIKYFVSKIYGNLGLLIELFNVSLIQKLYFAGYVLWIISSILIIYTYKTCRDLLKNKRISDGEAFMIMLLLWSGSIIMAYLYNRVLVFSWYDPLFTIPLLLLISTITINIQPKVISVALRTALLPLLLVQIFSVLQVNIAAFIDPSYAPEFTSSARVRNYVKVGQELYKQYPNARLLTSEIGGLGYGFEGYIYDGVGLVTPEALKYQPIKNSMAIGGIPDGYARNVHPDLIVSYDVFMQDLWHSDLLKDYAWYKYPLILMDDRERLGNMRLYNSDALNVFVRKDLPTPMGFNP